jgi:hypothetical protein
MTASGQKGFPSLARSSRHYTVWSRARRRRGTTLVELAICIMVFLTFVLGFIDLGVGLLRYHQLTDAVRHLARQAAVHGNLADKLGPWGPATLSGTADAAGPISDTLRQRLTGIPADQVSYTVNWIDGGNDVMVDHRVQVIASFNFQPTITFIFGSPTINLQSTAVVHIAH